MRKKILIVKIAYEKNGGIDKQIIRLAKALYTSGKYLPMLATSELNLPLPKEFIKQDWPVFAIAIGGGHGLMEGAKSLAAVVKREDIDFVQAHLFRESLVCRMAKLYCPSVQHVFRAQTYIDCAWIPEWKKKAYHLLDLMTSSLVRKYIANGPEVKKEIIQASHVNQKRVVNLINGTEKIGEPDDLTTENSLAPRMAMVSNLLEKKGHDVLIKALKILKDQGLELQVRLIGGEISGGYNYDGRSFRQKLEDMASEYGVLEQIEFYGYSSDIPKALKDIPLVVLPSDSEGVPNCISEGMSLRKLVIASCVGAVYELIDHGKDGFMHPPQDAEAFAKVLSEVYQMPLEQVHLLRNKAYEKWQNRFSLQQMTDTFISMYDQFQ